MIHLGLRVLAGALVASAITLLLVSSSHHDPIETRLLVCAWGLILGNAGITLAGCLFLSTTMREESDRNARTTAEAVGEAVGEVLRTSDAAPRLPSTRRGT